MKSVPLSVIVYSEILFMDDERPSLSSYSRPNSSVLAQYWLLKEKFLGSESGSVTAAGEPRRMDDDDGHTYTHYLCGYDYP